MCVGNELVKSKRIRWIRYDECNHHSLDVASTDSGDYGYFERELRRTRLACKGSVQGEVHRSPNKDKYRYQRLDVEPTVSNQGSLEEQLRDSLKTLRKPGGLAFVVSRSA
jgi:hypothetical protein